MKKFISLISILFLVSISLFASIDDPTLVVTLNLADADINRFGVSCQEVTTANVASLEALDLFTNELGEQILEIEVTESDETEPASFWFWWYVYSDESLKMYINFTPLTNTNNAEEQIPFRIIDNTTNAEYTTSNQDLLVSNINNTKLDNGFKKFTIQPIDKRTFSIANYSSTVTISIVSNV